MQRPRSKGPCRGSATPQTERHRGMDQLSIVGSNRGSHSGSRQGSGNHRSDGSFRSNGSSSFQRLHSSSFQQEQKPSSGGVSPVIVALQSCVKVFCTAVAPSYMLPWMRGEESHRVGCGFAALLPSGERRLFAHAQVVENCTLVQVRRAVDAQKFVARVRDRRSRRP